MRLWPFKRARTTAPPHSRIQAQVVGGANYREAPKRNAHDLLHAYNSTPIMRALVHRIASARIAMTWQLLVATSAGPERKSEPHRLLQQGDRAIRAATAGTLRKAARLRELETHPFFDLLEAGNPLMTGRDVQFVTYVHMELVGEAFWVLERNRAGMPVMIWPIPPSGIKRTPSLSFPHYEVDFRDWRENVPASEVIWFREPDPVDPYGRGTSIVGALADEWETGEYAGKHVKTYFYNDAKPPMIITGEDLSDTERLRMEETWSGRLRGYMNKYRPFFSNRKIDVKELSTSFQNMELVDLLKHLRDTEVQVLGIPPEILGILQNSNRATSDVADYLFAKWTLVPRHEQMRSTLQARLIGQFDDRLALDYVSPVAEDRDYELSVIKARPEAFTVDEYRVKAGHEPLPNGQGKGHLTTHAARLVTSLDELHDEPADEPALPPAGDAEPPDNAGVEDEDDDADPKTKGLRLIPGHVRTKAIREEDIPLLLARMNPQTLERVMVPIIEATVEHFGDAVLQEAEVGIAFEMGDPRIVEFLRTYAGERIRGMIDATIRTQLGETLAEAAELGETTAQWAARITDVFREATGSRAFAIARTENTRAAGFASREAMRQAGLQKSWLSVPDDRRRDAHAGLEGQVRPVDEPFVVPDGHEYAGATAMYPGDFAEAALSIECRCQLTSAPLDRKSASWRALRWKAFEQERMAFERQMEPALKRAFRAQEKAVLAALTDVTRAAA